MIRALRYFAALSLLALPTLAQGPVVLMGIDAEDNNPPNHGGTAPYIDVINSGILPNISNGGSGLLVIGGGKNPSDDVTVFWNLVAAGLGETVTYSNGGAIAGQSFAGFKVVAIASSMPQTGSGGLTATESNTLNTRSADIATHVNGGGGLFGTSQVGLPTPYGYLGAIGAFTFSFGGWAAVTATTEGEAVGITDTNMDVCCWHDRYLTFPAFLDVLATDDQTGFACAIGGAQVIIVQGITLTPLNSVCEINMNHTVTASVADNQGDPVVGTTVTFTVTAGPHIGTTFMDVTDANGQAFFTYFGTSVGIDTIQACFTDNNGVEQCDEVNKEWVCTPCVLTCPADVGIDCSASTAPANTGTPTGCANATFSDSVAAGMCAGSFVITRTWSAPDGCGGTATCVQTITVTDTTAPVIACPADASIDCSASTDPANTGSATATDDCSGVASISSSDVTAAGNCAGNFVITRTWTAVDGCGNSSSCVQTITVTDTTAPVIACPADASIDCSASTDPANTGSATATDDCSGVTSISSSDMTAAGNCAGNFVITRTWTAVDGCGNSSSCVQTITVTDTTAPVIACPADAFIDCADSTDPANTGSATAGDDCSGVASIGFVDMTAAGNCAGNFVITRTWTAVDGCGNSSSCVQTITATDTTAPVITCPADVTVIGCCVDAGIGMATATDDCGSVDITSDAPMTFCRGETVVTWTATDDCGNVSMCQQLVTVLEITLDFETDGAGDPLAHGQSLVTVGPETPYTCPTLTSSIDTVVPGNGNNGAAVFDSTNGPFLGDPDLGVGLGNILYLQDNGNPSSDFTGINGPDTWDFPNDDEDGGTLTFDFCGGVQALSVDLIDIDEPLDPDQASSVVLTDVNGLKRTYTVPAGWTDEGPGAAAVGTLLLDAQGNQPGFEAIATEFTEMGFDDTLVIKIEVRIGSSGAMDNLRYCPTGPSAAVTERNGSGANPSILTPASMPVVGAQWSVNLDCSAYGDGLAIVEVRSRPRTGGMSPVGDVLITGQLLHRVVRPYSGSMSQLDWSIPYDLSLCGLEVFAQGTCQESGAGMAGSKVRYTGVHLSNALDLVLGF